MATATWSEWGVEVELGPAWQQGSANAHAVTWALDHDYVRASGARGELFAIPWDAWDRIAQGPASTDPEDRERWGFEHEAVAELIGVGPEHLALEPVGYVGGTNLSLRVALNGDELDLRSSTPFELRSMGGRTVHASPLVHRLAQAARQFVLTAPHSRAEQLAFVARLKTAQTLVGDYPAVARRVSIALSSYLASFEVDQPTEFAAKWVSEGPSRVSLNLYVKGESEPLPLDTFDEKASTVDLEGRRTVLLTEGAKVLAAHAKEHRNTRKSRVPVAALRSPLSLVGDDVDTTGIDFSEYALEEFSHRVLGFEPAKRDKEPVVYTSGTSWYQDDGDGLPRFVIEVTTPTGENLKVTLESVEEVLDVAKRADDASKEPNQPFDVQGRQVIPTPGLGTQLRELAKLAEAPAGEEDGPGSDTDRAPRKPKRLRPVVDEIAQRGEEKRISAYDIERAVPWSTLEAVLAPGMALKAHQREGLAWLWHRYSHGASGALLADDMGLGKTLQIASFIALAKAHPRRSAERRPTLVVAPVVLIANWGEELKRFFVGRPFPGRLLELRDDALRRMRGKDGSLDREQLQQHDVVVTSYESLARYAPSLLAVNWDLVVLDEAHRIKNRGTSWSIAARGLSGLDDPERPRKFDFGICSTGTPVENHVMDLWALYDFASPGSPFGTYRQFCDAYERHPEAPRALAARLEVGSLESSLLRRVKDEVLPHELPGKQYHSLPVAMTDFQHAQERVLTSRSQRKGGFFAVLQALQKLYQHPWLLDEDMGVRKASPEEAIDVSPKLAATLKLLEEIRERGEKALVFTLWTDMQYLLKTILQQRFRLKDVRIINGDPPNRARALQSIQEFSDAPGFHAMVLSPLAAGVGLNIVAANHVIHYGRWWNPAKEDQATDRAYRIGQTRPIHVYYPVLHHPGRPDLGFDVKLDELVARKRSMARALLEPVDDGDLTEADLSSVEVEAS